MADTSELVEMQTTTFSVLYQPINNFLSAKAAQIDKQSGSRKLFFSDFVKILLFHFVFRIDSLRSLHRALEGNPVCNELGLPVIPFSTLKDGFTRFNSLYFKELYHDLLSQGFIQQVPELSEYGLLEAVDGSLFPTIKSMFWAKYKKTKNAIRLHVCFSLNTMVPVELEALCGNSSERNFISKILKAGITYIADRGYFSFDLGNEIIKGGAFLIFRAKKNLLYEVEQTFEITEKLADCFKNVSDQKVRFTNDGHQNSYRMIEFTIHNSHFRILTNRFDLPLAVIIMLYAYRWQIELLFKFLKRSMKGIHLLNNSPNGVNIHFYMLMTAALLQLKLKQNCIAQHEQIKNKEQEVTQKQRTQNIDCQKEVAKKKRIPQKQNVKKKQVLLAQQEQNTSVVKQRTWKYFEPQKSIEKLAYNDYKGSSPSTYMQVTAKIFSKLWKISKSWLEALQNALTKTFDETVIRKLSSA